MSITLGIYDFFSYIIPGILYLYVINDFLRIVQWNHVNVSSWFQQDQTPNIFVIIALLVVAFIIGHIFNPVAKALFDLISRVRNRQGTAERSLVEIVRRYPNLKIKFGPRDWSTLFVLIRIRNLELSKFIDKFNADALMLRNISFALILFTITYIVEFLITGNWAFLLTSAVSLIFCILAFFRSEEFRTRFFKHIYRASLEYGLSIEEVIDYNKNKTRRSKTLKREYKRV